MSSTLGTVFRVTTWGESHGPAIGAVVDGCPPGLRLSDEDLQIDLDRRRPGRSRLSSARREADRVGIRSGVFQGCTTGTPIALEIANADARPGAYDALKDLYRPSHADFTYHMKYGTRDWRGGGRSSARETACRVAAAAVARKLLTERWGVEVVAWVEEVAGVESGPVNADTVTRTEVDAHAIRCPDPAAADTLAAVVEAARQAGDTVGGVIGCVARGVPAGWGEPVFARLEAELARACLSLPAAKAFESGSGFFGTRQRGSEHNDAFEPDGEGGIRTRTNRSGGIQGGISNGMPVTARVGFKPVPTHHLPQDTVDTSGRPTILAAKGRHDPCVLPRAVPLVEAAFLLVLADAALLQQARLGARPGGR